jgi:hypothetical protein
MMAFTCWPGTTISKIVLVIYMKKQTIKKGLILGLILCLLGAGFISACNGGTSTSDFQIPSQIKNGNNEDFNHQTINLLLPIDYPLIEPPIDIERRKTNNASLSELIVDVPSEFSWKDLDGKDWTTPVQNQGHCGSCWLFAAMSVLESVINIREDCADLNPDLSEQYVLSCLPLAGSCSGGNVEQFVYHFIINTSQGGNYCNGIIPESCFPYQADDTIPCEAKCETWEESLVPLLDYWESWNDPQATDLKDTIKSLILQKGPVVAYFWVTDRFIRWGTFHKDPSDVYLDYNEDCSRFVNHGIAIVGWKDDPSFDNGGYWICKNSWGTNWGYDGFFNIEYDCLNMGGFLAWVDYDPTSFDWPPVADQGSFYQATTRNDVSFDASASIDPEGDIVSYEWDFGDGTTGAGCFTTHSYDEPGVYSVTLTVTDTSGQSTSQTTLVGIEQQPLQVTAASDLGITFTIKNPSNKTISDVNYKAEFTGFMFPNTITGTIDTLPSGGSLSRSYILGGLGTSTMTVTIGDFKQEIFLLALGPIMITL